MRRIVRSFLKSVDKTKIVCYKISENYFNIVFKGCGHDYNVDR